MYPRKNALSASTIKTLLFFIKVCRSPFTLIKLKITSVDQLKRSGSELFIDDLLAPSTRLELSSVPSSYTKEHHEPDDLMESEPLIASYQLSSS